MLLLRFTCLLILTVVLAGCSNVQIPTRSLPPTTEPFIEWNVGLNDSTIDEFVVYATLHNIVQDTIIFRFPNWAPGAYQRVEYGSYVTDFAATSPVGAVLTVVRDSPSTFHIVGATNGTMLRYVVQEINSHPLSLFTALSTITDSYAFANGTALHGYIEGQTKIPQTITYSFPQNWELSTGLSPADSVANSFVASDYDELVDAPILAGQFEKFNIIVAGKPHLFAVVAPERLGKKNRENIRDATERIVKTTSNFFGEMPYSHYTFQCFFMDRWGGEGYGALEHRNSSTYLMPWAQWAMSGIEEVIAHEYWHVWFPKRVHTHQLGPFDYQNPPKTSALWFIEGVTEYYSQVMLMRAKRKNAKQILWSLISSLYQPKADSDRSLEEISRASAINPFSSLRPIYTRGAVAAMLLDGEIRAQTNNDRSLDDAMRWMNEKYGKLGKTFGEDEIVGIIEQSTGTQLQELYNRCIASAAPLPLAEIGYKMGLRFVQNKDFSVYALQGINLFLDSLHRWVIDSLAPGSIADRMGLRLGDTMISVSRNISSIDSSVALNKLSATELGSLIHFLPENVTAFTIQRGSEILRLPVLFQAIRPPVGLLEPDPDATGVALQIRKSMFGM